MKWLSFGCLFFAACHSASVPEVKQPDGSWHLTCGAALEKCVARANELCADRGYVVLGGANKRIRYGSADGVSQVETGEADLRVACADHHGELPKVLISQTAVSPPPDSPPPVAPSPPATSCTPGITRQCVGPGACAGGQACLRDGSGFSSCDCGSATAAPAASTRP